MPFIEYALFRDYISKNLCVNKDKPKSCCHGKCYLKKQLSKSNSTSEAEGKNTNKKPQNRQLDEFDIAQPHHLEVTALNLHSLIHTNIRISKMALAAVFIPPETNHCTL